jgi:hypothetical protein
MCFVGCATTSNSTRKPASEHSECANGLIEGGYIESSGNYFQKIDLAEYECQTNAAEQIACGKDLVNKGYIEDKGSYFNKISMATKICADATPELLACARRLVDAGSIRDKFVWTAGVIPSKYRNSISSAVDQCKASVR